MAQVKNVEKKIWDVQGFDVDFKYPDGTNVRGDKKDMPQYSRKNASKNDMTVKEWKEGHFKKIYPGFDCDILLGDGSSAHGSTKLGTVRDSYTDDSE
ncbi:hypothetical protein Dd586_2402 [Dickeya parazeae Ech586]|uniref:Uncharacterized protein n=1 Tax=Dickeya zeae (strain Ech586) TaxID=590409 RepID=D2C288_DICZ5|nr:hypothetical protein [Dickeya parazeae]ACZ77252.1 hypothetical protein Dd586_2402 [Dickeya parazeae Ech586]